MVDILVINKTLRTVRSQPVINIHSDHYKCTLTYINIFFLLMLLSMESIHAYQTHRAVDILITTTSSA